MIDKFPKGGIQIMQDVHQIEVFRIPLYVELTELMEMKVTLKMDCAQGSTGIASVVILGRVPVRWLTV